MLRILRCRGLWGVVGEALDEVECEEWVWQSLCSRLWTNLSEDYCRHVIVGCGWS